MHSTAAAASAGTRKEPLALEEVLLKRAMEKELACKPKFMSKDERTKLALERRAQEVNHQRTLLSDGVRGRDAFLSKVKPSSRDDDDRRSRGASSSSRNDSSHSSRHDSSSSSRSSRRRSPEPRHHHHHSHHNHPHQHTPQSQSQPQPQPIPTPPQPLLPPSSQTQTQQRDPNRDLTADEMVSIRERYMGVKRKKRKIRRMNDRRFVFDWDESEDTSTDPNPLYSKRMEYSALGRGKFGGVDPEDKEYRKDGKREPTGDTRHWSMKSLAEMKERDWRIFKEDFDISTKGGGIPPPLRSWKESSIPEKILKVIEEIGYTKPTPIQRQSIPIGLSYRDIIGIAETGSGKTAGFLVPMLSFIIQLPKINQDTAGLGPYALIMVPTRELAQQIEVEAQKFAKPLGFRCFSIVGGHAIEEQGFVLSQGIEIVIATPGRLKDCLERHIIVLGQCTYLVMDEADRMIDMGFEEDMTYILDQLPVSNDGRNRERDLERSDASKDRNSHGNGPQNYGIGSERLAVAGAMAEETEEKEGETAFIIAPEVPELVRRAIESKRRQTTMFSATMPPQVERLARKYLRKPATVIIGNAGKAVDTVQQIVEFVGDENKKRARLQALLPKYPPPIIVFFNQKRSVDSYAKSLAREGHQPVALHGGKSQDLREASIGKLRRGEADILLATDVAGRGLDVPNVSLVINFDMAKNIEDYTHRIGRTGRAGKTGTAITFLTPNDTEIMYDLKQMLLKSPISKCPHELSSHESAQVKPGSFVTKRKFEETLYAR